MKNKDEEILVATLLKDPHDGKTDLKLKDGEELDVGQIEDFTSEQIEDLGLNINVNPIFLYWLNSEIKVSGRKTKEFDSLQSLQNFLVDKNIYCSWIKKHKDRGNIVMSFHEMPKDFDKELNELMNSVTLSIYNLMKYLKPVNAKMGDTKKITVDIFNTIKNYPYEESK